MAIRKVYGPSAATLAGVASATGTGRGQQDAAKQQAELDRMTLGALLQDRSQQADFNFRAAGMYQGAQNQNVQMQNDLQRQQIALNMGAQNQAWNAGLQAWGQTANLAADAWQNQQQLQQREQLIQQEMQQKQFEYDLRNSSAAQQAHGALTSQEQALERARADGFVTPEQYEQMRYSLAAELTNFNPAKFPSDSRFEKGKGIGEFWQEDMPLLDGSEFKAIYTRKANGDVEILNQGDRDAAHKMQMEAAKQGEVGKTPDAAKPPITLKDFASLWESVSKPQEVIDGDGIRTSSIPTPEDAEKRMDALLAAYRRNFDPNMPTDQFIPGVSRLPSASPGPIADTRGMTFGGQAPPDQPSAPGVAAIEQLRQAVIHYKPGPESIEYFGNFVAKTQPDSGLYHLQLRYPQGEAQLVASGDPYDISLFRALRERKQRATR